MMEGALETVKECQKGAYLHLQGLTVKISAGFSKSRKLKKAMDDGPQDNSIHRSIQN